MSKNSVRPVDLPVLLAEAHGALSGLTGASASAEPKEEKATPSQIRKSITPDAPISIIDGKPYKTLKRHLTGAGMTMEEYRQRFGLPRDYLATAANYSAMRTEFARNAGFGTKRRNAAPKVAEVAETVARGAEGQRSQKGCRACGCNSRKARSGSQSQEGRCRS
ncbi:MucR family transcriptional regulator [Methylobacterium sp.]|uniref:MucR family transcriptional regulator n=1 Tax=Methylobacterium sp. TaxID=409 RepID=UPI003B000662